MIRRLLNLYRGRHRVRPGWLSSIEATHRAAYDELELWFGQLQATTAILMAPAEVAA